MPEKIILFSFDLIEIDDDPEDIANDKDNHDSHEYHGDVLVTLLSVVGPLVGRGRGALGDGLVEHAVDHGQYEEGYERHHDEVGKEDVVACIAWVISHGCWTY